MNLEVALCLPREAESVTLIRGVISSALRALGVTPACVDDIRLALTEACTNVVQHAAPSDEYEVHLRIDSSTCSISVTNPGGFDANELDGVMPDVGSERGRGVAIMRAVMDHVDFTSTPEAGTIVNLTKALSFDR